MKTEKLKVNKQKALAGMLCLLMVFEKETGRCEKENEIPYALGKYLDLDLADSEPTEASVFPVQSGALK